MTQDVTTQAQVPGPRPTPDEALSVVVGYDGSPTSEAAVRWATNEVGRQHAVLRLVTAWDPEPLSPWSTPYMDDWRRTAQHQVDHAADEVHEQSGGAVKPNRLALQGRPAEVLVEEARAADLLVVGSAGHLGGLGRLAGSVSRYCVRHAPCPVVVVGPEASSDAVARLVTTSALDPDGRAAEWLIGQAKARHVPIHVVDSWFVAMIPPAAMYSDMLGAVRVDAAERHDLTVARLRERLGGELEVTGELVEGREADVLRSRSRAGDLIVVPFWALHDAPFAHARCPVAVLPSSMQDAPVRGSAETASR